MPNIKVVDEICPAADAALESDPRLAERFLESPAASGRCCAELKTFVTDRKGHGRRYAIDERKARPELNYAPERDFAQGLRETIAWYLADESW